MPLLRLRAARLAAFAPRRPCGRLSIFPQYRLYCVVPVFHLRAGNRTLASDTDEINKSMNNDLEQSAMHSNVTGFKWRRLWKGLCIGSFGLAVVLLLISGALSFYRHRAEPSPLFLVLDGILALVELLCWATVGISAIGWIICHSTGKRESV